VEGSSSADVVAKVVLKAVTTENPSLRHLAGKDAETWMKEKSSMSILFYLATQRHTVPHIIDLIME